MLNFVVKNKETESTNDKELAVEPNTENTHEQAEKMTSDSEHTDNGQKAEGTSL